MKMSSRAGIPTRSWKMRVISISQDAAVLEDEDLNVLFITFLAVVLL